MDAAQSLHPTDQILSSYGLGKLDDRAAEAVNDSLPRFPTPITDSRSECMSRAKTVVVLSSCAILVAALSSPGQDVIGPGSTVQGDILRGEGVYFRGRGIYELYSAKGRRIDAGTEIMIQQWNKQVYDAYKRERASHIQYRKGLTNAQQAAAKRKMAEKEERLRTNPTDDDVVSGDALNALLADLSDPMIGPSSWRSASVALPGEISIRSLFFRFAPRIGDKNSGTLSNNLIALGRLDTSRGWPIFIPEDKVGPERQAYEATYRKLLEQCEKETLKLENVTSVDTALDALKAKVSTAVPAERNFRASAVKYVADMQAATKIFDASTIDFAQEMIRDTHDYNPQTVGELLAFLRKYRLFFASASGRPDDVEVYQSLFGLMRTQAERLGVKPGRGVAGAQAPGPNKPRPIACYMQHVEEANGRPVTKPGPIQFLSNGRISTSDNPATWSFKNGVITMRWPNPQAPGGAWRDVCRLSADGRSYKGKNQIGKIIVGAWVSGSFSEGRD
jgi:hypothetical protein